MKQDILEIAKDLEKGIITEDRARNLLLGLFSVSQQRELLELLTEMANSTTIYSNTRHKLIAKKLLSSYSG